MTRNRCPKVSAVRIPHSAMPSTGLSVASRAEREAGIAEVGDNQGRGVGSRGRGSYGITAPPPHRHRAGFRPRADPRPGSGNRSAGPPGQPEWRQRRVHRPGHRLGRVRVDHDDALGHRPLLRRNRPKLAQTQRVAVEDCPPWGCNGSRFSYRVKAVLAGLYPAIHAPEKVGGGLVKGVDARVEPGHDVVGWKTPIAPQRGYLDPCSR